MGDAIGKIVFLLVAIFAFLILPVYYNTTINIAREQTILMNEVEMFMDKVADTKTITEEDLKDFTLAMASTTIPVEYKITREAKQVNPDPTSITVPKKTYTTWVPAEDERNYDDGDIIRIRVKQIGFSLGQAFSTKHLKMQTPTVDFTLCRMVR